jgi:hypothetical protein
MRHIRFSIAGLMGIVLVASVGLAAWRNANETWAGAMGLLTLGILALAVVGAIYREGARRAWWLGFSVFGWGYMALLTCCYESAWTMRPTTVVLQLVEPWMMSLPQPAIIGGMGGGIGGGGMGGGMAGPQESRWSLLVGQCLWVLLAASLGGILAWLFFASSRDYPDRPRPDAQAASDPPRGRWLVPTVTGLVLLVLCTTIATVRSGSNAPLWAGITFSFTGSLIGLAVLGAVCARGRRRPRWLGAALFGAGYTALIFSRPVGQPPRAYLATDQILKVVRPWFSSVPGSFSAPAASILESLERPIPMQFNTETPLEGVLDHIRRATATPDYPGIPVYVDPLGLQEAERSLNSTVQIDLEGVPLRATLALCLKQLGLGYEVKDGFLRITHEEQVSTNLEDPFLIVGHCLLALLAAGFGAVAAPTVADAGRTSAGPRSGPVGDARPT